MDYLLTVSTMLARNVAYAPFVLPLPLGLHWPFFGPDLCLGAMAEKVTCTAPGPEPPANAPVLLPPTTLTGMSCRNVIRQVLVLSFWWLVGLLLTITVRFPARLLSVLVLPLCGPLPPS